MVTVADHAEAIVQKLFRGLSPEDFSNLRASFGQGHMTVHRGETVMTTIAALLRKIELLLDDSDLAHFVDPDAFYVVSFEAALALAREDTRMEFLFHEWVWKVDGEPDRVIVPAHVPKRAEAGSHVLSRPIVLSLRTRDFTNATIEDSDLPWADCPEARNEVTRACDQPLKKQASS